MQMTLWNWVKSLMPAAQPCVAVKRRIRPRVERAKPKQIVRPRARKPAVVEVEPVATASEPAKTEVVRAARPQQFSTKQGLYDEMVRVMCAKHGIRVRRWRTSMSGIAWEVRYRDGTMTRLIESPRPRSPMSAAIFLHEVGHHAIGFNVYKPRCLEEYHAWMYSLAQMEAWGVDITDRVKTRVQRSLKYAVGKARRRGIKSLPAELAAYL